MNKHPHDVERLRALPKIPFSQALHQRILAAAQSARESESAGRRPRERRWNQLLGVSGMLAAAAMVAAVLSSDVVSARHGQRLQAVQQSDFKAGQSEAGGRTGLPIPASVSPQHVQAAPLEVESIWIGSDAEHPGNVVYARLRNNGSRSLGRYDVIGVLGFGPGADKQDILGYEHLILTNGPDRPIRPGAEGTWSFRPLGVSENEWDSTVLPHLWFLQGASASAQPSPPWQSVPGLQVQDLHVQPGVHPGQVEVGGFLLNDRRTRVSLDEVWAIVWLAPPGVSDWTNSHSIRFISSLRGAAGVRSLAAGQSHAVYFPLLGPDIDYRQLVPHLMLVQPS
ncbi:hypothetical protein [Alicyclobacillus kakegawensis]|uniref:hypothetical protein n=1 Tax=Alicyclobacillus kakegawensis TaxID=392012 RepID=UPI00082D25A8|nr:hypothetical protein [Alicyclobacillus kakegawensis]